MHRRPMIFFSTGDCPCSTPPDGIAPCVETPATPRTVCNDKYLTLTTSPKGQVLIVPKEAKCQVYLSSTFPGFLFFTAGEVSVTKAPKLTLPLLNPAVDDAYPEPASFDYLAVADGADPASWYHLRAPSVGEWTVGVEGGKFLLKQAGTIPGLNDIGESEDTETLGGLLLIVESPADSGEYVLTRLAVADKRVVVGFVDADTGASGFKTLPDADFLEHPKAAFTTLRFYQLETLDSDGDVISGGMELAVVTGGSATTDGVRMIYSPAKKRLFKAPAHTIHSTKVDTPMISGGVLPPVTFGTMPGGYGAGSSLVYNYPTVRIDFTITFSLVEDVILGVFRDSVLVEEFASTSTSFVSLFCIDEDVPFGSHTYDVRWRKLSGTGNARAEHSNMLITTIG